MPVKVRCPSCEKSLSAPDAARGKAIKCPGCGTKIRVPGAEDSGVAAGEGGGVAVKTAKKKKAVGPDSTELLANLDLSKAVDSSSAMCPKCGTNIPEDASECPKCGVDPATGLVSASAKRRLGRKGPDPAEFYSAAWKNSWQFTRDNMRTVVRVALLLLGYTFLQLGCAAMVAYCTAGTPPQFFWFIFLCAATLITPGLIWALTVDVTRMTLSKKSDLRDVIIDTFQNMALGIKTILWTIAYGWAPFAVLMYPLAMIHMAMPVSKRAWFWPSMVPIFFRNLGPALYYWLIATLMNVPLWVMGGLTAFLIGEDVSGVISSAMAKQDITIGWKLYTVPPVTLVLGIFWYAFSQIFLMRVIGLIAYYRRETLDLVTLVAEKEYVRKEVKLDAFGNPLKTRGDKVKEGFIVAIVIIVVAGAGYFVYRTLTSSNEPPPQVPAQGSNRNPAAPTIAFESPALRPFAAT